MSDVINAVARLERAGSSRSKATVKLHAATTTVAKHIIDTVGSANVGVKLPRGYRITNVKSNVGASRFLLLDSGDHNEYGDSESWWINGGGYYLHRDFHCWIPEQTREGSLRFAKDVAEGLLDEIAGWMAQRASEDEAAAGVLENA